MTPTYLAVDLETTGLDPERCRILEIAAIILDENLEHVGGYSTTVATPTCALVDLNPDVQAMHLRSGLFSRDDEGGGVRLTSAGKPLHEIEAYLIDAAGYFPEAPILTGSSVHFDRRFIRRYMPDLNARLSHRHLEANTCRLLGVPEPKRMGITHRALADINASIEWLRAARDMIRGAS